MRRVEVTFTTRSDGIVGDLVDLALTIGRSAAVLPRYSTQMPLHLLTRATGHVPRRVTVVRDFCTRR